MPHLAPGDLVIDGGNSYFKDTDARSSVLAGRGIELLGVGISGGERGARHGAGIMAGGSVRAYDRVRPLFQALAAEVAGEPCAAYLGPGSAGHYVSMVQNGVEHGVTQLIAEIYDLMSRGLGMSDAAIQEVFGNWGASDVSSSLLGILARRLRDNKGDIGAALFDLIVDETTRNAAARWASIEARDLNVPTPTIDLAIAVDTLSGLEEGRAVLRKPLGRRPIRYVGRPDLLIDQMKRALRAGMIVTLAQGMALLRTASDEYEYDIPLQAVARVWRGSVLRSPLLEEIYDAFYLRPLLPNLLSDSQLGRQLWSRHRELKAVVRLAIELGIPAPALSASLTYYEGYQQIGALDTPGAELSIERLHESPEKDELLRERLVDRSSRATLT
jgi:6-phosphogluconate dehydrogenase